MDMPVEKKIVFDNLYTGYEAEVMRFPLKNFNKDIIISRHRRRHMGQALGLFAGTSAGENRVVS